MPYSSRKRYKSRRERYHEARRKFRIIGVLICIGVLILLFKNRYAIWDWLYVLFY